MAVTLTGTEGLFTRLGRIGKLASLTRIFQGGLGTYFNELLNAYNSSLRTATDGVATLNKSARLDVTAFLDALTPAAQATLLGMMKADKPNAAGSVVDAVTELIKQMKAASQSVAGCTVTASGTALSTNTSDGVVVMSGKRGDGLTQELAIPEIAYLMCTGDSQTGGTTLGEETFTYTGEVAASGVWDDEYPIGSGTVTDLTAVSATDDAAASTVYGNLLTNGAFEDFTSNLPDNWVAAVGTAAVNFQRGSTAYSGTYSLQFIGSAVNTSLTQTFDLAAGTLGVPLPSTSYAVQFWAKCDVVPAAGVLTVDLIDGSGNVVNDDQGTANTESFTLSGFTTSFASKSTVFRLPKLVPSTLKIRLRMSTALSTGSNLFVDHLAMGLGS